MREATGDAPGRVNLIGEHTDYHDGLVMPCALPQRTHAHVRSRDDNRVIAWSAAQPEHPIAFTLGAERPKHDWSDYVQGIAVALRQHGCVLRGFDLDVHSDVPVGSGLSSSAALEVALIRALRALYPCVLSDVDVARLGQQAEVEFVGAPVGIMDQMAASVAKPGEALFLDTRSLAFERIPLPDSLDLVVIDSGVPHRHASGGYATRRAESEAAAAQLGVAKLRDVDAAAVARASLPDLLGRRARHVVTENERVLAARLALLRGDLVTFGDLLTQSHISLRDDYQVSLPEIDLLVELAWQHPSVYGARLTGGGFGGAILIAAHANSGPIVAEAVVSVYAQRTQRRATVLIAA